MSGSLLSMPLMWLIFGLADLTAQTLIQRIFAAKNERAAQNAFYYAGFGYLAVGIIPVMLGIIASVTMPGLADPEAVIPMLAIEHLHPIAIAVFVGAMLAAIMSSADSALLATASIISVNVAPFFKKNLTDRQRLLITRISIPVVGIIAVYVALKVQKVLAQTELDFEVGLRQFWNVRDVSMTDSLRWILEREGPAAKIVVAAHNSHLQQHPVRVQRATSMGSYYTSRFDHDDILFIGAASTSTVKGEPPNPQCNQAVYEQIGPDCFFLDLREAPSNGPVADWLGKERADRSLRDMATRTPRSTIVPAPA